MGADYPVYLPSATPYLRLWRQGASWPSGTLANRPGAPGETGYGELRRPWARVPLTSLPLYRCSVRPSLVGREAFSTAKVCHLALRPGLQELDDTPSGCS